MKFNRKIILSVAILLLCCLSLSLFCACNKDAWKLYESHWNIKFPEDTKTQFQVRAIGFPGDGISYSILYFDGRPDEFLEDFDNDEDNIYRNEFAEWLEWLPDEAKAQKIKYDESKVVMPSENCIWKKVKGPYPELPEALYMAYDEVEGKLYVLEHLM